MENSRTISQTIKAPADKVYEFASQLKNLPKWASGVDEATLGRIKIEFVKRNEFGILDHDVTLENGATFYNPMRVVKSPFGSEIIFTLFRQPGMSDADFEKDAATIAKDLRTLRDLVE